MLTDAAPKEMFWSISFEGPTRRDIVSGCGLVAFVSIQWAAACCFEMRSNGLVRFQSGRFAYCKGAEMSHTILRAVTRDFCR
jgi:hypothetical protein